LEGDHKKSDLDPKPATAGFSFQLLLIVRVAVWLSGSKIVGEVDVQFVKDKNETSSHTSPWATGNIAMSPAEDDSDRLCQNGKLNATVINWLFAD